ncbi:MULTISPECIES: hypothetical protein [unclassified Psychrobacter]|uniref:hypothetical protein n=1 Tax=unclassified Psychrobacter TaxID=196806 RepID=UPI0017881099|nr:MULTISPECIES: hypothetical protein [unclassified Psychrobacter]MBE0442779.1 hypothetical protein [Psychrobacter sp. FME13]MBE0446252.1 hypothetical protein [Psychrobacter sp. FME5]
MSYSMQANLGKSFLLSKHSVLAIALLSLGIAGCQNTTSLSSKDAIPPTHSVTSTIMQTKSNYADIHYLTIDGQDYPVSETSARIVVNNAQNAQELMADIFDGERDVAVPGYKVMIINRTSSVAAEGRKRDDGSVMDNRMIHRGSKSLVGIPVVNGQAKLDQAQLLSFDIIYDDVAKDLAAGTVVKPRGTKLTKSNIPVTNKKVVINSLTLPNIVSGEHAGGGVNFEASAVVDGKVIKTGANSAFNIFYTVTSDKARGF